MVTDADATRAGKSLQNRARPGKTAGAAARKPRFLSKQARISLASVGCVIILWFAATSWFQLIPAGRFPSPAEFWAALRQAVLRGYAGATLAEHVWHSLRLVVTGFICASLAGIPLGLLMGYNRIAEALINPIFSLIRPIPPLAWIPLAILWLGLGDAAKVLVIWLAAFVPSVINAYTGVRGIDGSLFAAARMLGAPRLRMLTEVIVPGALPMIFTGLRLSLQAAWTTLVAAELVGALMGVGFVLNVAQQDIYPSMILVGMVTVGVLGWLTTKGLVSVERMALARWPQGRS